MTLMNMSNTSSSLFIISVNPMSHIVGGGDLSNHPFFLIHFFTLINSVPIPILDRWSWSKFNFLTCSISFSGCESDL